jgi:S1-C subfamily serine protease
MDNPVLKVVALLLALALVLGVGLVAGGGIVYVLTHAGSALPVAKAQASDPGYGVVVASVVADGPAAKAGVVRGDILLEVNGSQLESAADLTRTLSDLQSGDEVTLTVLHGDEQRTLTATLAQNGGRAYLGLTPCGGLPESLSFQVGTPGALITEVIADSPAAQAGLQKGDVITSVDGQTLDADHSLSDLITSHKPGDQVTLEVVQSGGESVKVEVVLGQNPDTEGAAYLGVQYTSSPRFELPMNGLPPFGDLGRFQFGNLQQGAIIRDVTADSPASAAGLQRGDVITAIDGEPVESPQSLTEAIAERKPGDRITLTIYRQSDEQEIEVNVTLGTNPTQEGKAYLGVSLGGFFRIQRSGDSQEPGSLQFFGGPFEWPFGQEGSPFYFQFPSPPDDNSCNGSAGCLGESA